MHGPRWRSIRVPATSGHWCGRSWNHSNFNRATQARRQPGSAFKPFVYTAAMDNGFHPTDVIVDEPVSFPGADGELYQPQNYDGQFRGAVTLRYALQQSINIPAIKLLRKVGTSLVASYARRMGIKSPLGQNLSLALGSSEGNLLELTSAYGVFANRGVRNDPVFVLKVMTHGEYGNDRWKDECGCFSPRPGAEPEVDRRASETPSQRRTMNDGHRNEVRLEESCP